MQGSNKNQSFISISQCLCVTTFLMHTIHVLPSLSAFSPPGNATDEQALLSFKALITGDPHGVLSSWITSNGTSTSHYCQWHGVACRSHRHPQRVTALELSSSNLTGMVSPYLANLTSLHTLDLSSNQLRGGIPWELGRLPRLRSLLLRQNSLGGEIPSSLTHLSRLRELSLSYNNLVGEIPANFSYCSELRFFFVGANMLSGSIPSFLGSLSKLRELAIYGNNLTGGIPLSLGNLSSLELLAAAHNSLGGEIPESLGRITTLQRLDLTSARLTGTIPLALFNMSSLIMLALSVNNLSGVLPRNMGLTLPNLQFLYLYLCNFQGQIPRSLVNASRLRKIDIQDNEFEGTVPSDIGKLGDLDFLALNNNRLEARKHSEDWEFLTSLANCSKLKFLGLSQNNFRGIFPASLLNLSTELDQLRFSYNKIHGAIPQEIGKFSKLTVLDLSGNLLTDNIPFAIGELHNLGVLALAENNMYGEIPPMLGNLTLLSELYLNHNNLQGNIPRSFGSLAQIDNLDLSYNQLSGMIPKQIVSLSSLSISLDLSHNVLMGHIPLEVGNLNSIVLLDLSENKLTGEIPSTLGECLEMGDLFLQGNLLQGMIPKSLSGMKGIQRLDISQNNLSGPIPEFFTNLPDLYFLNLSYNKFEGPVPAKGVFSNASAFFITGNRVCGGIPELQLPHCPPPEASNGRQKSRTKLLISVTIGCIFVVVALITCGLLLYARKQQQNSRRRTGMILMEQHWRVSHAELHRATNGFSTANLIGVGSFGSVYRGTLDLGAQEVAVKVLNLLQHGAERSFLAECEALRSIRHRNLVKVITACSSVDHHGNDFKALVYEFMPNGDLDKWLHPNFYIDQDASMVLTMAQRVNIALDVAAALDYLHHHGQVPIIHCDLKPSNVILDNDMVAHIGDFGLSRFVRGRVSRSSQHSSTSVGIKGSIGYIAPEYGMGGEASVEGDVYSYGVLVLELFTAKRPTDDMFQEGRSLQSDVAMACSERIMEIVDPILLQLIEEAVSANAVASSSSLNEEKMRECVAMIFQVGLRCTEQLPKARMHIGEVIRELNAVKNVLLGHMGREFN